MIHHPSALSWLTLALVAGCATAPAAAPTPTIAKTESPSKSTDPCAALPECPPHCPEPVGAMSSRSCGSEGLQCGADGVACACKDGAWSCEPIRRPRDLPASCEKHCNDV